MTKVHSPLLGFNNNVRHKGRVFHIQTEDSGVRYPHVITHLFADGGRILKSAKTSYAEHVGADDLTERVRALMKDQHKAMFIALRDGQFDSLIDQIDAPAPSVGRPMSASIADALEVAGAPVQPKPEIVVTTPTPAVAIPTIEATAKPPQAPPKLAEPPIVAVGVRDIGAKTPDPTRKLNLGSPAIPLKPPVLPEPHKPATVSPPRPAPRPTPYVTSPKRPAQPPAAAGPAPAPTAPVPPAATAATRSTGRSGPAISPPSKDPPIDIEALERAASEAQHRSPIFNEGRDLPPPPPNVLSPRRPSGSYRAMSEPPKPVQPPPQSGPAGGRYSVSRPAAIFATARPSDTGNVFGEDMISGKSLDEVILSFLSEEFGAPSDPGDKENK